MREKGERQGRIGLERHRGNPRGRGGSMVETIMWAIEGAARGLGDSGRREERTAWETDYGTLFLF